MENEKQLCAAMLEGRLYLYTLFAKAFGGEPTEELLSWLGSDQTGEAFELFAEGDETLGRCGEYLRQRFGGDGRSELLERCSTEHTSLFYGFPAMKAVPSESYYRSSDNALLSEVTLSVRQCYRRAGLQTALYPRIPDDGLGLEMAFMASQAERSAEAFAQGDWTKLVDLLMVQSAFLGDHLGAWLPQFAEDLRVSEKGLLYPQLAQALAVFAAVDSGLMNNLAQWLADHSDELQAEEAWAEGDVGAWVPRTTLGRAIRCLQVVSLPHEQEAELVRLAS